jgi:hypothetical protein
MPDPFANHLVTKGRGTRVAVAAGDYAPGEETHVLVKTTAPASYDYGYVIPVVDAPEGGDRLRWVLIPEHSLGYQTNRYLSAGNALVEESDDLDARSISAAIWARIRRSGALL